MFWCQNTIGRAVAFAFLLLCTAFSADCQTASDNFVGEVRTVPEPVAPAPFSTARVRQTYSISFHDADQLSSQDRLLIANAESTISELARPAGLDYGDNQWKYRQIACPAFPNHLFLRFSRDNGRGDVSLFSVSIPRNGQGKTRLIPILKRSYSLFSPAPINALTISAFNHIRAEEGQNANDDWLGNALCYAALAASQPQISSADAWPSLHNPVPPFTSALDVQLDNNGQELISFDDTSAPTHPMEWTMTFRRDGKLIKATHKPTSMLRAQPVSESSSFARTQRVP